MAVIPLRLVPQLLNEYVFSLLGPVYLICWPVFVIGPLAQLHRCVIFSSDNKRVVPCLPLACNWSSGKAAPRDWVRSSPSLQAYSCRRR